MILITGANGFIGSALAAELNQRGHHDLILSDYVSLSERPKLLKAVKYHAFYNPDELLEKTEIFDNIQLVFHMGACSSTTETNWDYLKKVNLDYSIATYQICEKRKIAFYYASSAATYGDGQLGFDDKRPSHIYTPLNLYGKSKKDFDVWMQANASANMKWAGFRFFNVFGPNEYFKENMASMVYKGFLQIQKTGRLKLFKSHNPNYKDGEQLRDFVYVKDVVRWLIEISESKSFENGIYNMGFGEARTWLDLAKSLFRELGKDPHIEWMDIPENIRDQYQYYTKAELQKLSSQNLSAPAWSLEKSIHDYVKNYLMSDEKAY